VVDEGMGGGDEEVEEMGEVREMRKVEEMGEGGILNFEF
jgi:hypothetical protein